MTLLQAERARNPNTVTTFGGDLLSPSLMSGLTKGSQMIDLTNAIGVQVAVLGNHEFDFGPELAAERIKAARYPWLGTNVLGPDGTPAVGSVDLHLIEVAGYKLGFFGVLTPDTATLSSPGDTISFAAPPVIAAAAVKKLREMGADLVVAHDPSLFHGRPQPADRGRRHRSVLGGHDHDPISFLEDDTLIAKAGSDLHYLAVVDLRVGRATVKDKAVVVVTPSWRFCPRPGWRRTRGSRPSSPAGPRRSTASWPCRSASPQVDLDTRRASVRSEETNFGDLVGDALRNATRAEVALTNGGGIRGDRLYPAGTELTRKDILTQLPFGNVAVLAERERRGPAGGAGERRVAGRGHGRALPQVSGMSFVFDPTKPPARGSSRPRSAARRSIRPAPTGSRPAIICWAAATAMPA